MAFASGGARGTANSKTSGTTLSVTLTGSVSVGDLLVVWAAWDNETGLLSDSSAFNLGLKCQDSQGNIYCQLYSQTASGSSNHARAAIFLARIRTALTTSDTVTITCQDTLVAKAASLHRFTMDTSKRWAIVNTQPANAITSAADPPALTLGSLTSRPYLLLHVLAAEGPETDAYTWDADYTQVAGDGTTGGADDENIHVRGGYRIATLTTDTVDVTSTTADRDYVQGFVAVCEVDYDSIFPAPENGILDDANRADENPADNGDWNTTTIATTGTAPPGGNAGSFVKVVSNQFRVQNEAHVDNNGGSWWDWTTPAGVDADVYASCPTIPSNSSVPQVPSFLPDTNAGSRGWGVICYGPLGYDRDGVVDGVEAKWERDGRLTVDDKIRFGDPQISTVLPFVLAWVQMANGNKIGVQKRSNFTHMWIDQGSGWAWLAAIDQRSFLVTTETRFGLDIGGNETRVDDFGGGPVDVDFVPQIIRRPPSP